MPHLSDSQCLLQTTAQRLRARVAWNNEYMQEKERKKERKKKRRKKDRKKERKKEKKKERKNHTCEINISDDIAVFVI